jgi:hypothetical protein
VERNRVRPVCTSQSCAQHPTLRLHDPALQWSNDSCTHRLRDESERARGDR